MKSVWLVALVFATGCSLYFTGGDDCFFGAPEVSDTDRRDPFTGACVPFQYPCDGVCGPCTALSIDTSSTAPSAGRPRELRTVAEPDWAVCYNACGGHDEAGCAADPQCRVIYDANSNVDEPPRYRECWGIAPSGPADPGGCSGLDAYECSRHNDCVAYYDDDGDQLRFTMCVDEVQGCYSDEDCGSESHCSTSDGDCQPPPGCGDQLACPAVCYGSCVPDQ
jgi:hypothetical protein